MKRAEDGGLLSILAAVAAALASAGAKALFERRRRSPIKSEEQEMCRNHSHVVAELIAAHQGTDYTEVEIRVVQPLTVEILGGASLTLPPFAVCLLRSERTTPSLDSQLLRMEELAAAESSRAAKAPTSGPTIQQR